MHVDTAAHDLWVLAPFARARVLSPRSARARPSTTAVSPARLLPRCPSSAAAEDAVADERLHSALAKVGFTDLVNSLDRCTRWSDILSIGEQQRIGFPRALLTRADVLLLDEATSALDEASEAALFPHIAGRTPNAAIVSIGHRSTLAALHHRTIDLDRPLALAHSA